MWQKSWRDIGKMHFPVLKMSDHLAAVVNLSKKLKGKCSPVCKLNDDNWLKPIFLFLGEMALKKKIWLLSSAIVDPWRKLNWNQSYITITGWLGVKHQVTYLPTYWTENIFFLVENITDHLLVLLIFPGSWPERCVFLLWRVLMI